MEQNKPILTTKELIKHLKSKGISFEIVNEAAAEHYLSHNNNYFKLASFRKNYPKHSGGKEQGKYISLDFAYLQDLAIIDMRLRYIVVQMALDIEHYIKMQLLSIVESKDDEDGYKICTDYINSLDNDQQSKLENEILRNEENIYCGGIVKKYNNNWPIWAFLEVIPFGRLVSFYKFCADRFHERQMQETYYQLLTCKEIRNAAAHSSCILNDLHLNTKKYEISFPIRNEIKANSDLKNKILSKRLSNERIRQITTLLYVHSKVVTSDGVHRKTCCLLYELKRRINENISYYDTNDLVRASLAFIAKIIDIWFF